MTSFLKVVQASALAFCVCVTGAAQATVFFEFVQTSLSPSSAPISVGGWIAVSDDAYASGLSVRNSYGNWAAWNPTNNPAPLISDTQHYWWLNYGIEWIEFRVDGASPTIPGIITVAPDYRAAPDLGNILNLSWVVSLQSNPFEVPTGGIFFNSGLQTFEFILDGATSSGRYASDLGPFDCFKIPQCSFTGDFFRAEGDFRIPEPGSLMIVTVGMVGLAAIGRRRKVRDH